MYFQWFVNFLSIQLWNKIEKLKVSYVYSLFDLMISSQLGKAREGLCSRFYVRVCMWVCLHANGSCSSFADKDRGYHRTTMDNFITYPWTTHAVSLLPLLCWDPSSEHYYLGERTVNKVLFHQYLVWWLWQSLVKALWNHTLKNLWIMKVNVLFSFIAIWKNI